MKEFMTKYGMLKGISSIEFYTDGIIKECKLSEYCEINTSYGILVPQYDEVEVRRKYKRSLSFYKNGNLQSISFQSGTNIVTSVGKLSAELAVFHENGQIKRIFPLNGKITGYWTEENEYELSEELDFHFEFGKFKKKIIGINFYESGGVKSLTLWPKDFINILSPYGMIETRIGFSLYPNGAIKSCEPRRQTLIKTVIGELHAFDFDAIGLNADTNSLNFKENGTIKSLYTSLDKITIKDAFGSSHIYEPGLRTNNFNDTIMDVVPLRIEFYLGKVKINETEYNIESNTFCVDKFVRKFF
ncbi:hypothetical protein [Clostridium estertheticum]|uniref:MORN repeat variant n=1 Tax=Clostridium estertheticum TaxID=238834 RepID=A0AA47EME2_9CLOT|nr:hypothetical protein [Clostridium estertheticum]MBU3154074.1 hypothetical protein [Clostridium estertheticum]WAG62909.1 hypothetical protein LL038_12025 [Clostridium estertheticum]